jgi:biotin-(acetyl-CoA carboxylase) ligase
MICVHPIQDVPIRLKWPNDIYAEDKCGPVKIGGVLVNSHFAHDAFILVAGMQITTMWQAPSRIDLFERLFDQFMHSNMPKAVV